MPLGNSLAISRDRFQRPVFKLAPENDTVTPLISAGTAAPVVQTRNSDGTKHRLQGDNTLLLSTESANAMRYCSDQDTNGREFWGFLSEDSATNLFNYSEDFHSNWTKQDAGDTSASNAIESPDGNITADSNIADTSNSTHGFKKSVTLTSGTTYAMSCFMKPGDRDWIVFSILTTSQAHCYFDVTNKTVGNSGSNATGYIVGPYNNGFYRCIMVFTSTVSASCTHRILSAESNGDNIFAGDGITINNYFWGAQLEEGSYASSYIPTNGATATRQADVLRYKGDDGNLGEVGSERQGCACWEMLMPSQDPFSSEDRYIFAVSDGGDAAHSIRCWLDGTYSFPRLRTQETSIQANINTTGTSVLTNTVRSLKTAWKTDDVRTYDEDGIWKTDTSGTVPDDLDRIDVGCDQAQNNQLSKGGLIGRLSFFKRFIHSPSRIRL